MAQFKDLVNSFKEIRLNEQLGIETGFRFKKGERDI